VPSGQVQQGREMWSGLRGREEKSAPSGVVEMMASLLLLPLSCWVLLDEDETFRFVRRASRSAARWTSFLAEVYSSTSCCCEVSAVP